MATKDSHAVLRLYVHIDKRTLPLHLCIGARTPQKGSVQRSFSLPRAQEVHSAAAGMFRYGRSASRVLFLLQRTCVAQMQRKQQLQPGFQCNLRPQVFTLSRQFKSSDADNNNVSSTLPRLPFSQLSQCGRILSNTPHTHCAITAGAGV
jgi:hypothetical protein